MKRTAKYCSCGFRRKSKNHDKGIHHQTGKKEKVRRVWQKNLPPEK